MSWGTRRLSGPRLEIRWVDNALPTRIWPAPPGESHATGIRHTLSCFRKGVPSRQQHSPAPIRPATPFAPVLRWPGCTTAPPARSTPRCRTPHPYRARFPYSGRAVLGRRYTHQTPSLHPPIPSSRRAEGRTPTYDHAGPCRTPGTPRASDYRRNLALVRMAP